MSVTIGGVEIGPREPCRFVVEVSNAHNGDFHRALRLIRAAAEAGADFVKFQCYTPDELVALRGEGPAPAQWGARGWSMRTLYDKARTPHDWFVHLFEIARSFGLVPFSSVFGPESLALLESIGCPAYKVARLDNRSGIVEAIRRTTEKPLIVSYAFDEARQVGYVTDVRPDLRLCCPEGYPQQEASFDGLFNWTHGAFGISAFDGFSYHGTDPLPCVVAATAGAQLIEAHIQLDDEPSELEENISLTASQFAQMIRDVRRVEAMLA